jgi:hypothetical protein
LSRDAKEVAGNPLLTSVRIQLALPAVSENHAASIRSRSRCASRRRSREGACKRSLSPIWFLIFWGTVAIRSFLAYRRIWLARGDDIKANPETDERDVVWFAPKRRSTAGGLRRRLDRVQGQQAGCHPQALAATRPFDQATDMKFTENRAYANPEAAARKLIELANADEAVQGGRIFVELINGPMLFEHKATPAEYSARLSYLPFCRSAL